MILFRWCNEILLCFTYLNWEHHYNLESHSLQEEGIIPTGKSGCLLKCPGLIKLRPHLLFVPTNCQCILKIMTNTPLFEVLITKYYVISQSHSN